MTREEPLSSNHRQNLIEDFRQAKMDSTTIFCSRAAWKNERRGGPRRCYRSRKVMLCSQMVGANASLRQAGVGQLMRIGNAKRSMSSRAAEYKEWVQLHAALQSAVYCKLVLALTKDTGHFGTEEGQLTKCFEHGGEDPSCMQRARGR